MTKEGHLLIRLAWTHQLPPEETLQIKKTSLLFRYSSNASELTFKTMAYSIFISYRRATATWFAGRLYDSIKRKYKEIEIFMDVDEISGGEKFKKKIDQAIYECIVFIPVIDEEWGNIKNHRTGEPRLFMQNDFLVFEMERALLQEKNIIPILVENSNMPSADNLPPSIQSFIAYNAKRLKHESWQRDIEDLFGTLSKHLPAPQKKYKAFISSPMTSFDDRAKFNDIKQTIRKLITSLNVYCNWRKIYYSGNEIGEIENIDPPAISSTIDLNSIKNSDYFIMVYPEKLSSSCLTEAGYALALQIPSIYFVKRTEDLPYILKEASSAYSFINTYIYNNDEHLAKLVERISNLI